MDIETITIEKLNALNKGTLMEHLSIEYVGVGNGWLAAKMPVNEATFQPDKILHGGASIALAETVAGVGSALMVDLNLYSVRGAQVSANHIKSASKGVVTATAKILYKGSNSHVWNIDIVDDDNKLISTCRITNIIIKK